MAKKRTFSIGTNAGNPERARLSSQSEGRIRFILPARGFSHITNLLITAQRKPTCFLGLQFFLQFLQFWIFYFSFQWAPLLFKPIKTQIVMPCFSLLPLSPQYTTLYQPDSFSLQHEKLFGTVWTTTAQNWNRSLTHITLERLAERVWCTWSQFSPLNIYFRLSGY